MGWKRGVAIALAVAALAPASAHAGLVGYDPDFDSIVTYDGRGLLAADLVPEVNDVEISSTASSVSIRERGLALVAPNPIYGLNPFSYCTFNLPSRVVCRASEPGGRVSWSVELGAHDDRAVIVSNPAFGGAVLGGGGRDVLIGSPADDVLSGGRDNDRVEAGAGDDNIDAGIQYFPSLGTSDGADSLRAGDGDDVIRANDGVRDEIDCGAGDDRAIVDSLDATSGCEIIIPQPPE